MSQNVPALAVLVLLCGPGLVWSEEHHPMNAPHMGSSYQDTGTGVMQDRNTMSSVTNSVTNSVPVYSISNHQNAYSSPAVTNSVTNSVPVYSISNHQNAYSSPADTFHDNRPYHRGEPQQIPTYVIRTSQTTRPGTIFTGGSSQAEMDGINPRGINSALTVGSDNQMISPQATMERGVLPDNQMPVIGNVSNKIPIYIIRSPHPGFPSSTIVNMAVLPPEQINPDIIRILKSLRLSQERVPLVLVAGQFPSLTVDSPNNAESGINTMEFGSPDLPMMSMTAPHTFSDEEWHDYEMMNHKPLINGRRYPSVPNLARFLQFSPQLYARSGAPPLSYWYPDPKSRHNIVPLNPGRYVVPSGKGVPLDFLPSEENTLPRMRMDYYQPTDDQLPSIFSDTLSFPPITQTRIPEYPIPEGQDPPHISPYPDQLHPYPSPYNNRAPFNFRTPPSPEFPSSIHYQPDVITQIEKLPTPEQPSQYPSIYLDKHNYSIGSHLTPLPPQYPYPYPQYPLGDSKPHQNYHVPEPVYSMQLPHFSPYSQSPFNSPYNHPKQYIPRADEELSIQPRPNIHARIEKLIVPEEGHRIPLDSYFQFPSADQDISPDYGSFFPTQIYPNQKSIYPSGKEGPLPQQQIPGQQSQYPFENPLPVPQENQQYRYMSPEKSAGNELPSDRQPEFLPAGQFSRFPKKDTFRYVDDTEPSQHLQTEVILNMKKFQIPEYQRLFPNQIYPNRRPQLPYDREGYIPQNQIPGQKLQNQFESPLPEYWNQVPEENPQAPSMAPDDSTSNVNTLEFPSDQQPEVLPDGKLSQYPKKDTSPYSDDIEPSKTPRRESDLDMKKYGIPENLHTIPQPKYPQYPSSEKSTVYPERSPDQPNDYEAFPSVGQEIDDPKRPSDDEKTLLRHRVDIIVGTKKLTEHQPINWEPHQKYPQFPSASDGPINYPSAGPQKPYKGKYPDSPFDNQVTDYPLQPTDGTKLRMEPRSEFLSQIEKFSVPTQVYPKNQQKYPLVPSSDNEKPTFYPDGSPVIPNKGTHLDYPYDSQVIHYPKEVTDNVDSQKEPRNEDVPVIVEFNVQHHVQPKLQRISPHDPSSYTNEPSYYPAPNQPIYPREPNEGTQPEHSYDGQVTENPRRDTVPRIEPRTEVVSEIDKFSIPENHKHIPSSENDEPTYYSDSVPHQTNFPSESQVKSYPRQPMVDTKPNMRRTPDMVANIETFIIPGQPYPESQQKYPPIQFSGTDQPTYYPERGFQQPYKGTHPDLREPLGSSNGKITDYPKQPMDNKEPKHLDSNIDKFSITYHNQPSLEPQQKYPIIPSSDHGKPNYYAESDPQQPSQDQLSDFPSHGQDANHPKDFMDDTEPRLRPIPDIISNVEKFYIPGQPYPVPQKSEQPPSSETEEPENYPVTQLLDGMADVHSVPARGQVPAFPNQPVHYSEQPMTSQPAVVSEITIIENPYTMPQQRYHPSTDTDDTGKSPDRGPKQYTGQQPQSPPNDEIPGYPVYNPDNTQQPYGMYPESDGRLPEYMKRPSGGVERMMLPQPDIVSEIRKLNIPEEPYTIPDNKNNLYPSPGIDSSRLYPDEGPEPSYSGKQPWFPSDKNVPLQLHPQQLSTQRVLPKYPKPDVPAQIERIYITERPHIGGMEEYQPHSSSPADDKQHMVYPGTIPKTQYLQDPSRHPRPDVSGQIRKIVVTDKTLLNPDIYGTENNLITFPHPEYTDQQWVPRGVVPTDHSDQLSPQYRPSMKPDFQSPESFPSLSGTTSSPLRPKTTGRIFEPEIQVYPMKERVSPISDIVGNVERFKIPEGPHFRPSEPNNSQHLPNEGTLLQPEIQSSPGLDFRPSNDIDINIVRLTVPGKMQRNPEPRITEEPMSHGRDQPQQEFPHYPSLNDRITPERPDIVSKIGLFKPPTPPYSETPDLRTQQNYPQYVSSDADEPLHYLDGGFEQEKQVYPKKEHVSPTSDIVANVERFHVPEGPHFRPSGQENQQYLPKDRTLLQPEIQSSPGLDFRPSNDIDINIVRLTVPGQMPQYTYTQNPHEYPDSYSLSPHQMPPAQMKPDSHLPKGTKGVPENTENNPSSSPNRPHQQPLFSPFPKEPSGRQYQEPPYKDIDGSSNPLKPRVTADVESIPDQPQLLPLKTYPQYPSADGEQPLGLPDYGLQYPPERQVPHEYKLQPSMYPWANQGLQKNQLQPDIQMRIERVEVTKPPGSPTNEGQDFYTTTTQRTQYYPSQYDPDSPQSQINRPHDQTNIYITQPIPANRQVQFPRQHKISPDSTTEGAQNPRDIVTEKSFLEGEMGETIQPQYPSFPSRYPFPIIQISSVVRPLDQSTYPSSMRPQTYDGDQYPDTQYSQSPEYARKPSQSQMSPSGTPPNMEEGSLPLVGYSPEDTNQQNIGYTAFHPNGSELQYRPAQPYYPRGLTPGHPSSGVLPVGEEPTHLEKPTIYVYPASRRPEAPLIELYGPQLERRPSGSPQFKPYGTDDYPAPIDGLPPTYAQQYPEETSPHVLQYQSTPPDNFPRDLSRFPQAQQQPLLSSTHLPGTAERHAPDVQTSVEGYVGKSDPNIQIQYTTLIYPESTISPAGTISYPQPPAEQATVSSKLTYPVELQNQPSTSTMQYLNEPNKFAPSGHVSEGMPEKSMIQPNTDGGQPSSPERIGPTAEAGSSVNTLDFPDSTEGANKRKPVSKGFTTLPSEDVERGIYPGDTLTTPVQTTEGAGSAPVLSTLVSEVLPTEKQLLGEPSSRVTDLPTQSSTPFEPQTFPITPDSPQPVGPSFLPDSKITRIFPVSKPTFYSDNDGQKFVSLKLLNEPISTSPTGDIIPRQLIDSPQFARTTDLIIPIGRDVSDTSIPSENQNATQPHSTLKGIPISNVQVFDAQTIIKVIESCNCSNLKFLIPILKRPQSAIVVANNEHHGIAN